MSDNTPTNNGFDFTRMAENFNLLYPKIISFIEEISNVVYTFLKSILTTIFIPVILVLVIFVEIPRVQSGIQLFDSDPSHSLFASAIVVFLLLVLQFLIHHKELANKHEAPKEYQWSLRIWFQNFKYKIGWGTKNNPFEKREKSPASDFIAIASLVEWGIIVLSVVGTMQPSIKEASTTGMAWYNAIVHIFMNSTLDTVSQWVVGLIFAKMIVNGSSGLAKYISHVASEVNASMIKRASKIQVKRTTANLLSYSEFVKSINSRLLNNISGFSDEDKFDYNITEAKVRFYNSQEETFSEWYDISTPIAKQEFYNYMRTISNDRLKVA